MREVGDESALLLFAFRVSGARLWREGGLAWCGERVWMGGWVVGLRMDGGLSSSLLCFLFTFIQMLFILQPTHDPDTGSDC